MNKFSLLLAAASAALAASPLVARPMTATDLHMMHRVGAPEVSPDGKWAVFTISDTDLQANKRNNRLYLLELTRPGAAPQLVKGAEKGHDAVFGPDGALWFLMAAGEHDQLFRMPIGGAPVKVSNFSVDVSGFKLAPSGNRLVVWADRPLRCPDLSCALDDTGAKHGGSGRTYDQLFVRHWDTWAEPGVRSRLFGFPVENGRLAGAGLALTDSLVGDTPSKPFGGGEEMSFSPDGRTLYFALREAGRIEALSTNLDIFAVPSDGSAPPINLTDSNDATDNLPAVSPDGRTLAYFAMARPGYEADRQVLQLRDLATGSVRPLTQSWDRSVGSIAWSKDGKSLLVTAEDTLEQPVFRVDAATGAITRLTRDGHFDNVRPLPGGGAIATMNNIMAPDDIYRLDPRGNLAKLTDVNGPLLAQLDPLSFRKFSFAGAHGDTVWGWTLKPASSGKLPIAFLVHGGPQGTFSNSWSYRWNPRVFTSPGYAAVTIDFHGSTGYGQAFTDAIRDNWGGWPLEDLQKGLAFATANDPQLDAANACALGGSYGGYMMNWIEGKWPDRFKCLVQHDGVFDARAMAYETEELWFDEWEHGGHSYYEAPQAFEKWNPVNYVQNWRTPQLVVTSEKDFRIPYTQGIAAFTALQRRNIPSRLLIYPDENHWVLKPRNSIQWYDEVFGWLGQWLGRAPAAQPPPQQGQPERG
jgi:dipeptidyl aminopeptidase/acylaminoacyl peptidase